jgi:hypothetical protein
VVGNGLQEPTYLFSLEEEEGSGERKRLAGWATKATDCWGGESS